MTEKEMKQYKAMLAQDATADEYDVGYATAIANHLSKNYKAGTWASPSSTISRYNKDDIFIISNEYLNVKQKVLHSWSEYEWDKVRKFFKLKTKWHVKENVKLSDVKSVLYKKTIGKLKKKLRNYMYS